MLLAHPERRCDEVVAILGRPGSATTWQVSWQVTQELIWSRDWASVTGFMRRAALAKVGAHLPRLSGAGGISRTVERPGQPEIYALAG